MLLSYDNEGTLLCLSLNANSSVTLFYWETSKFSDQQPHAMDWELVSFIITLITIFSQEWKLAFGSLASRII